MILLRFPLPAEDLGLVVPEEQDGLLPWDMLADVLPDSARSILVSVPSQVNLVFCYLKIRLSCGHGRCLLCYLASTTRFSPVSAP